MKSNTEARADLRDRRYEFRQWLIEQAGGRCKQCGFSDWRALEFDHTHGGGNAERRQGIRLIANNLAQAERILGRILLGEIQVLCANCHAIKTRIENETRSTYEGS